MRRNSLIKLALGLGLLCSAAVSQAIAIYMAAPFPPGLPVPNHFENFDAIAPGSYVGFPIMAATGTATRVAGGGLIVIDNGFVLPGMSAPNSCWGRDALIELRFNTHRRWFGGYFRVPAAGIAVNMLLVRFYDGVVLVGAAAVPVNMAMWLWRGWYVSPAFNRILITGNAFPPVWGYVAMDNIRTRP